MVFMPINRNVVTQHAENAAFFWLARDLSIHEPHYSLDDLTRLDGRVEANLDGLRIAGDAGWKICEEHYAWDLPGEIFAAAVLAFETLNVERMERVVEIGIADHELSRGLVSAFGWLSLQQAQTLIDSLLAHELAAARAIGIAASAIHRKDPGGALRKALQDDDPALVARAAKAAGELGRTDLIPLLQKHLRSADDHCRFRAAWSGTLLKQDDAPRALQSFAVPGNHRAEEAVVVAARGLDLSSAQLWQKEMAGDAKTMRLAVICAGAMGDPVLIPWLISQMENPELARPAGESFTMITGVDLAYEDLDGDKPEGFQAGPTEDPDDEDVAMDPDEDLSWPKPELILKWWDKNKGQFQNGQRYLVGKPVAQENLMSVFKTGRQRQRAAAALELALLNPGKPLFEVRAPGWRQKRILGMQA